MTGITLYNGKTRSKEAFTPIDPKNVRMYVCGPTVYDRAHLGNARPVVVFDVLFRLMRHVYGTDHVTYVRNFTDVDDKINAKAAQTGRAIRDITDETIRWYHADMDALGALRPTLEPRATEYIPAMVAMIEGLIAKGHAYAAEGHVLFDVRSYPQYGQLSGRSVDDMIAGARVEVAPYKRDPMDFVLWKPSSGDQPGWDGPKVDGKSIGHGRPGWHIECSAMAFELLGESFDIHGGGLDLQFPHHENELAQSACAHDHGSFARYWMHNEMLQVEGKKMSKSLGNFFTVRDLLDQGIPGEVIRFVMLSTHYRKPMDWTKEKARQAERTLSKWWALVEGVSPGEPQEIELQPIYEDLNTPDAIQRLRAMATALEHGINNPERTVTPENFLATAQILGLLQPAMGTWMQSALSFNNEKKLIEVLKHRTKARAEKKWPVADLIREGLTAAGIEVKDTPTGTTWSIGRDVLDSLEYFHSVRSAFAQGEQSKIKEELARAARAGVHFSKTQPLDVAHAWRGEPEQSHIDEKLSELLAKLEALK